MRFRPCIDIHNGKVKQIVGGSLRDANDIAKENYISEKDAAYYAALYRRDGLSGGHIILLNPVSSEYYEATKTQALQALLAYPGGMQLGGGITAKNAREYLDAGASHVIVTSYAFQEGKILFENLERLKSTVGRERIVLDLSCRKNAEGDYYIVTDRWQTFTDVKLSLQIMEQLEKYCDEYLIHGVDVEGKASGPEARLLRLLTDYDGRPVTYAGGIGSVSDLKSFRQLSEGKLDFTIGSALDLFGGGISYEEIRNYRD